MIDLILISLSLSGRCDERQELEKIGAKLFDLVIADLDEPVCFELLREPGTVKISESIENRGLSKLTKCHLGYCEDRQEEG